MKKILIIDIETTDFFDRGGKIVEIGIVELDLNSGNTEILFDNVMHERPITLAEVQNAWIVKNSDLTVEAIRRSEQLEFYRAEIQQILNGCPAGATAYNNEFDFGFMEDRGFVFPKKLPCPMKLSTNICKLPKRRGSGYKWPNVQECWNHFFGETTGYVEKHRGADDAAHESKIVYELYKMGVFKID